MNSIHFVDKSRSLISSVEHLQPLANGSDSGYAGDPDFSSAVSQTARYRTELSAISESIGWLQATTYKRRIPSISVCAIECHEVKVTVFSVDSKLKFTGVSTQAGYFLPYTLAQMRDFPLFAKHKLSNLFNPF